VFKSEAVFDMIFESYPVIVVFTTTRTIPGAGTEEYGLAAFPQKVMVPFTVAAVGLSVVASGHT
jgi:hypothetical protein